MVEPFNKNFWGGSRCLTMFHFSELIRIWHTHKITILAELCLSVPLHQVFLTVLTPKTHAHLSMILDISEKHKVRNIFRCEILGPWQSLIIEPVGFYSGMRRGCNEVLICFISMEQGCKGERSRWVW